LTDDEQFLERWSRRKTATRPNSDLPSPETDATDAAVPMETSEAPDEIDPEDLPDIDSLDENSDFSAFMRNGVPEALRNRALRKLWQTDPAFNVVDGLLEYGEDAERRSERDGRRGRNAAGTRRRRIDGNAHEGIRAAPRRLAQTKDARQRDK
jgi:hypothetical protein